MPKKKSIANKKAKKQQNYGYKPPVQKPEDYVLGGLGISNKKVLNPERDWLPYIPLGEVQRRNIETYSCTSYGTLNCIEILERRLFQVSSDYSERFTAIGSGNEPDGNDPNTVAQWIRKNGLINESELPFTDTIASWEEYMTPKPLTDDLLDKGQEWLKNYDFRHEWVFTGGSLQSKQEKLLEALKYSPVGVSVNAWRRENGLYVKNEGEQDNHWCVLVAGEKDKSWIVLDTYLDDGEFIKKLAFDYDFGVAKLFQLKKVEKKTLWQKILEWLKLWQ